MVKPKVVVTAADCRRDTFRVGGKGGQNVNKRETGVRWTHEPSGAVGECREHRQQAQNEREAWRRMAESPRFKAWSESQLRALEEGYASVEAKVEAAMAPENLRVELAPPSCAPGETFCDKEHE